MQNINGINILQQAIEIQRKSNQNYVSEKNIELLAEKSSLSKIQVVDSLSFYEHISFKVRGKHIIRFCKSPCCYFNGEKEILETVKSYLNIAINETSADGCFTLELTNCIGNCDCAPAMMIDEKIYGNLTVVDVIEIIERIRNNG